MSKVIGVMPLYDGEKDSYWMLPGYMTMLESAGAVPLMLPLTDDEAVLDYFLKSCGGFLLTGGHDVSPSLYGAERLQGCGECCPLRDKMDSRILAGAVKADKPVLGICRGIQLMNAATGGTLYQDLPAQRGGKTEHHMAPPYDRAVHGVDILKATPFFDIFGKEKIGVNSYHHQAVKELSPAFKAGAVSEDGIIEGIYMPDKKFIVGVQWHPEFFYKKDVNSRKLIAAFVSAVPEA